MRWLKRSSGRQLSAPAITAALAAKGLSDADARALIASAGSLVEALRALGLVPPLPPAPPTNLVLPPAKWGEPYVVTGSTGLPNGTYDLGMGVILTVSGGKYTTSGTPT